ncbi:MutS protein -like protein 4 [Ceratocystis lukuohia]|uniref:MutS protein -like protein 4 n=1 Tax=Ceratocystis lukuohia TaxID=2019550 RepID=A0ABR4MP24_9PEZI
MPPQSHQSTGSRQSRPPTSMSSRGLSTASGRKSRAGSIMGNDEAENLICALSEARGVVPSVGICFINVSTGEVSMSQICDNQFYVKTIHKLRMHEPSYILVCSTFCSPNQKSTLYSLLEEHIVGSKLVSGDRSMWNEAAGLEYIQNLAFREDAEAIKVAIQGNFYAICSFSAAMKYLESEYSIRVTPHSLRIKYQPSEDTMMIDISAVQSLELVRNLREPRSKNSLYGLLNHTQTPMGARILRSNILQPSTLREAFLIPRYDALSELTTNEAMFIEIRQALQKFSDIEKILTKMVFVTTKVSLYESEQALNQVLMVKQFLESVPQVHAALLPAKSPLLTKIRDLCRPEITHPVLAKILESIEPDVTYAKAPVELRNQRTFAVKRGINGLLDVARKTFKEGQEDIYSHFEELNSTLGVNAQLKYDPGRKYWLQVRANEFENRPTPEGLINCIKKRKFIQCQTLLLLKLNQRVKDSEQEVIIQSDAVIQSILDFIRTHVPHLFRVCESIALLDMISSFGQLVTLREYVKPEINGTLALKAARHPLMDVSISQFVPNDFYSSEDYHFQIVTGCNMSGKSTYIRSVALFQIMAQIGCFVPAEYASFPIIHSIFARVSTDDSIEANMSTFSIEMREMAFILRNVDENSMAIIDELGRGTSTRDGLAIAVAMAESLIKSKARVWFTTHFLELGEALQDRPGVLNLHLATHTSNDSDNTPKTTMLYKVESGVVDNEHYGLRLAKAMEFPPRFIAFAEAILQDLQAQREASKHGSERAQVLARRRLVMNLFESLKQVVSSEMDNAALWKYLARLQEEFINRMEELSSHHGDSEDEGSDCDSESLDVTRTSDIESASLEGRN